MVDSNWIPSSNMLGCHWNRALGGGHRPEGVLKADVVGFDGRYYLSAARGSLRAVIRGETSGGEPRNGTRGFDKPRS